MREVNPGLRWATSLARIILVATGKQKARARLANWQTGCGGLPVARLYLGNTWSDSTVVQQSHQSVRVRLLGSGHPADVDQSQAEAGTLDQSESGKVRPVVARPVVLPQCVVLCVASGPCSYTALYPSILSLVRLLALNDPFHHPHPH